MPSAIYRFDRFTLDPVDRRLTRDGLGVELNARYLDALALLVREGGGLVTKRHFMAEVWRGVPVTDEALTQCIRTLRRALGDDAAAPRFIETVPKHGYRFVAAIRCGDRTAPAAPDDIVHREPIQAMVLAGAVGGAAAGAIGGVIYGFTFDAQPTAPGIGAASVLIVLLVVCAIVGAVGGVGVGGGIALARALSGHAWRWAVLGGAGGGLVVGALVKLLATDAFQLLLGRPPGDITGALDGMLLGAAVGLGGWMGRVAPMRLAWRLVVASVAGGLGGALVVLSGGRLMGGSLDLLARGFVGSRLRMDQIGRVFGEPGFGSVTGFVTAALEGALFAACLVGVLTMAARRQKKAPPDRERSDGASTN